MRVVSLLPSLTELVCELGRGDWLVGVTHECDFPTGVERLPHLTRSRIDPGGSSAATVLRDKSAWSGSARPTTARFQRKAFHRQDRIPPIERVACFTALQL